MTYKYWALNTEGQDLRSVLKLIEILDTDYQQGLTSFCILIKIKINKMRKLCDNILHIRVAHDTIKKKEKIFTLESNKKVNFWMILSEMEVYLTFSCIKLMAGLSSLLSALKLSR